MRVRFVIIPVILVIGAVIAGFSLRFVTPAPFTLRVVTRPAEPAGQNESFRAIAGQRCVFLIVVEDGKSWWQGVGGLGEQVEISAQAPDSLAEISILPLEVTPGSFSELIVIPYVVSVNSTLTLTITGERRGLTQTKSISIEVIPGEDGLCPQAAEMRERFLPWLAVNHPELGIPEETEWIGTIVNPNILVVMHYIFLSEEWEIYLTWHVTIPPHDWTRIYLRQRFTEESPSHAFEISSVEGDTNPHSIEVPDWV